MKTYKVTINILPIEPETVTEAVTPTEDGYLIIVDENSSQEKQLRSMIHAMQHILNGDFDNCGLSVSDVENKRHRDLKMVFDGLEKSD